MSDWRIVLQQILLMFLVILVGWVARRRRYISLETTASLSRMLVDVIFPCMVIPQMLRTVTLETLRHSWYIPALAVAVIVVSAAIGFLVAPLAARGPTRATALFLVAVPNWVYLPLPIAEALFGDEGVSTVLLFNVGAQIALWTLGVGLLRGQAPDRRLLKAIVMSPGLVATVAGVAIALLVPDAGRLAAGAGGSLGFIGVSAVVRAMALLGSVTIPLSLLLIGSELGGIRLDRSVFSRAFTGVCFARLILALPAVAGLILLLDRAGFVTPHVPRMVTYIVACMPVAISSSVMAERFGGDTRLAASAIFFTSFLSLVTVPAFYFLIQRLGL